MRVRVGGVLLLLLLLLLLIAQRAVSWCVFKVPKRDHLDSTARDKGHREKVIVVIWSTEVNWALWFAQLV